MTVEIYADGCCIGNHLHDRQQRSSFLAFIVRREGKELHTQLDKIPAPTNQQAEWAALVEAVKYVQKHHPGEKVELFTDCQTVVRMIEGEYRARQESMRKWHDTYKKYSAGLDLHIQWIPREENIAGQYLEKHLSSIKSLSK